MEYSRFQVAVINLASRGTRITVANVVAKLEVDPDEAELHLDRMQRGGRLEIDDEDDGVTVYRVRGLSSEKKGSGLASLREAAEDAALAARVGGALAGRDAGGPLAPDKRRKLSLAVGLGAIFPGFGLVYAAPLSVSIAGVVAGAIAFKILSWLPFFISGPAFLVLAAISGVLGGLYAWQYNQMGKRSPLGEEGRSLRRLASRLKG